LRPQHGTSLYLLLRLRKTNNTKHIKESKYNAILNTIYQRPQKEQETQTLNNIRKATFTYHGKETREITRLFKNTHIKSAFKTKNTIENILKLYNI
jgi:predicted transcriptional regulator